MSGDEQSTVLGLDEFDGNHGYVRTKGFVNWEVDLNSHQPRQKVVLGDSSLGDVKTALCDLPGRDHPRCGKRIQSRGFDNAWKDGDKIKLKLNQCGWASKFYDPADP